MRRELNVLALLKGSERYIYVYDDESRKRLVNVLRDDAANPRLSLSWFDVAVMAALVERAARTTATSRAVPAG